MKLSYGLLLIGCFSACFAAPSQIEPEVDWLNQQRELWHVPGVVAVIAQKGREPKVIAVGLCNVEKKIHCTERSQFPIASNTKFFTGLLSAILHFNGQASITDTIQEAWPEFRLADDRWQEMTLADVLSQRSGIGSVDWPYFWLRQLSGQDYLDRLRYLPMSTGFRESWSYGNSNFVIAGEYLRRKSGQTWFQLMREHLLKPAGMDDAGFELKRSGTRGYQCQRWECRPYEYPMSAAIGPAGALVLTGRDYLRFFQALLESDDTLEGGAMLHKALPLATKIWAPLGFDRRFYSAPSGYGFGVIVASYRGQPIWYHEGGANGFTSHFAILPNAKTAVAVMSNLVGTAFNHAAALDLLDATLGVGGDSGTDLWLDKVDENKSPPLPDDVADRPPTRPATAYSGTYGHPAWGEFRVTSEGSQLKIQFGEFSRPLLHHRYDSFSFATEPGYEILRIRFSANHDGTIDSFVMDDSINPTSFRFVKR